VCGGKKTTEILKGGTVKRLLIFSTVVLGAMLVAAAALAHPGPGKKASSKSPNARHGKLTFVVETTDNGSCGAAWANDTVKRTFIVTARADGSYTLTRLDRGTFVTLEGVSPGACDTTGRHGHTVRAGVHGKFVGFLRGKVTGGTFDPHATCTGDTCGFTDVFLTTFFGPNATFSCFEDSSACKFNFNYTAAHHQALLLRHWQDKGKGAGTMLHEGFHGDIADA
jgi:hypothetical protein